MEDQKTSLTNHSLAFTGLSNFLSFAAVQFCSSHLSVSKYTSLTIQSVCSSMKGNLCFNNKYIIHLTRDGNSGTTKKTVAKNHDKKAHVYCCAKIHQIKVITLIPYQHLHLCPCKKLRHSRKSH